MEDTEEELDSVDSDFNDGFIVKHAKMTNCSPVSDVEHQSSGICEVVKADIVSCSSEEEMEDEFLSNCSEFGHGYSTESDSSENSYECDDSSNDEGKYDGNLVASCVEKEASVVSSSMGNDEEGEKDEVTAECGQEQDRSVVEWGSMICDEVSDHIDVTEQLPHDVNSDCVSTLCGIQDEQVAGQTGNSGVHGGDVNGHGVSMYGSNSEDDGECGGTCDRGGGDGNGPGHGRGRACGQGHGCSRVCGRGRTAGHGSSADGSSSDEDESAGNGGRMLQGGDGSTTSNNGGVVQEHVEYTNGQGNLDVPEMATSISVNDTDHTEPDPFQPFLIPGPHIPDDLNETTLELDLFCLFMDNDIIHALGDSHK